MSFKRELQAANAIARPWNKLVVAELLEVQISS